MSVTALQSVRAVTLFLRRVPGEVIRNEEAQTICSLILNASAKSMHTKKPTW